MSLVGLLIFIVIIGLILYLIQMLPMDARIKQLALVVAIVIALIYLLAALTGHAPAFRIS